MLTQRTGGPGTSLFLPASDRPVTLVSSSMYSALLFQGLSVPLSPAAWQAGPGVSDGPLLGAQDPDSGMVSDAAGPEVGSLGPGHLAPLAFTRAPQGAVLRVLGPGHPAPSVVWFPALLWEGASPHRK